MINSRLLFLAVIIAFAASCTVSQLEIVCSPVLGEQEITIVASWGDPETRTERASDGSVLWSPGDQISLFYGSGANGGSCFTAQNTETAKTVNFTGTIGVITGGNNIAVEDTYFWAVYPYNATASCDGNSITTVLPSEQVANADTFADDLFPSMGRSQGLNMSFYNICGGIKFTVSEEDIKSVMLKANGGEQIVGTITAAFDGGVPVVTNVANGSDTITLTAPEGETFEVGKAYFLVMVPTVFESGFTMTFSKGYARAERVISSKATIKRSVFGTMNTPDANLEWEMLYVPIPDENFRAYMIQNFDTNGNGVLDFDEAESVVEISIYSNDIHSLLGIEYCKNLVSLSIIGSPDASNPIKIYEYGGVLTTYDSLGQITSIDLSKNTKLERLICRYNQLSELDLSHNPALSSLDCTHNHIVSLGIENNAALVSLDCSSNRLTSLDLTTNTALLSLSCVINQLTNLDVSQNRAIVELNCSLNKLQSLDVSNNTSLTSLECKKNQLTSLDISKNIALIGFSCECNQLADLNVSHNVNLTGLSCGWNLLTSLDVSKNTSLNILSCNNNKLTSLDLSHNPELSVLECEVNNLTNLDVTMNPSLTLLFCYSNSLTSLDLSSNASLTQLWCTSNQLTSLDISNNLALSFLYCDYNYLSSLDVSNNSSLLTLNCSPMNDNAGQNLLCYLYIAQGQSIPNVTIDRSTEYIPAETVILVAPETGGNEGTIDEPLD